MSPQKSTRPPRIFGKRALLIGLTVLSGILTTPCARTQEQFPIPSRPLDEAKVSGEREPGATLGAVDSDSVELEILRSRQGDAVARARLNRVLSRGLTAIDPVWGGVYQPIESGETQAPVIEKSLLAQAENIQAYVRAAFALGNPRYRDVATKIAEFALQNLWSEGGGFNGAQRVVVAKGLSVGEYLILRDVQRKDIAKPTLAAEMPIVGNARMVEALSDLYASTLDERFLEASQRALAWLESRTPSAINASQMSDEQWEQQARVASAELSVYSVTADRSMLKQSVDRMAGVAKRSLERGRRSLKLTEPVQVARDLNLAYRYSGRPELLKAAEVIARERSQRRESETEEESSKAELLARELTSAPLRLTVVGAKESLEARLLWEALLSCGAPYKQQEWLDAREGPLMSAEKQFPTLARPAAFICFHERCSVALFTEAEVKEKIAEMFPPL